jgi:hypothetical protein
MITVLWLLWQEVLNSHRVIDLRPRGDKMEDTFILMGLDIAVVITIISCFI